MSSSRRREEARLAVVDEVALVDRLEAEPELLRSERGEDGLRTPFVLREKRLLPERALARGLVRDHVPHADGP